MNKKQIFLSSATLLLLALGLTGTVRAQDAPETTTITAPAGATTKIKQSADGSITVTVNGAPAEFAPTALPRMLEGRVMVPLRGVIEKLGGTILYDAKSKVVTGAHQQSGNQFRMRVGSDEALLNGQNMPLDAPPRVIDGVTYVPLRFVSQAMGAGVKWDAARHTVIIQGEEGDAKVKTTQPLPDKPE